MRGGSSQRPEGGGRGGQQRLQGGGIACARAYGWAHVAMAMR